MGPLAGDLHFILVLNEKKGIQMQIQSHRRYYDDYDEVRTIFLNLNAY